MSCPDADAIQAVIDATSSAAEREAVLGHAEGCDACRALLGELVRGSPREPAVGEPGSRIGPFTVTGVLGRGAMGVVVSAHDPDLDREVAIKLLHPQATAGMRSEEAQARLLREAQAMAKVSHPGVIAVHQVGTVGDEVFVVMEKVAGGTLRAWLRWPRTWREIRDAFVAAGRGLATAHAAGLVHRDFKPENVLVGDDGRVRVTDFGLVGVSASPAIAAEEADVGLTRSGALVGTPRYMAPEQHRRAEVDARADQFAFCVALYEALEEEPPFAGGSLEELADAVCAGRVRAPTGDAPAWLRRAVLRGLSVAPAARYPSMDALLVDLEHDQVLVRRRRALVAVAAGAVAAAAVAWAALGRPGSRCDGGEDQLAGAWDVPVRAAVKARFDATGKPWAGDAFARVAAGLDARARAFAEQHRGACLATARGEQSEAALDLRMACLRSRVVETRALTQLLAGGDADVLARSPSAVAELDDLADCADVARLAAPLPPPSPAVRAAVDRVRDVLQVAAAEDKAGQPRESLVVATGATISALAIGYRPLEAEAYNRVGRVLLETGEGARAETALERAVLAADAGRHDDIRVVAEIGLVDAAVKLRRFDEARTRADAARAALERRGADVDNQAYLASVIGGMYEVQGLHEQARPHFLLSLAWREQSGDAEGMVGTLISLGNLAHREARWDEAERHYQRAIDLAEKIYGPSHPQVASAIGNLGQTLLYRGQVERAQELIARQLSMEEGAFGTDSIKIANTLGRLGQVCLVRADYPKARAQVERALAIYARAGVDDPPRAYLYTVLGVIAAQEGKLDEALAAQRSALALRERLFGAGSWMLGDNLTQIGTILANQGKLAEAVDDLDRAAVLFAQGLGPDNPQTAWPILRAGEALTALKRYPEAGQRIQRALTIFDKSHGPDNQATAAARHALGQLYLREGRFADALAEEDKARAALEKVLSPDNVEVSEPLTGMGEAQLGLGHPAAALAALERALVVGVAGNPIDLATTRFALARALWASGGDRARARALAAAARATFADNGNKEASAEVDGWLARHRSAR
jgi:tetratricopeptide (TPR) repeat protein